MLDAALGGLPTRAGVGFKAQHFDAILADPSAIGWIEVHAENYMGGGGRPHAQLRRLAETFPVSCHGVGLSIGSEDGLSPDHLARLDRLCDWLKPASFSEHLAWSTHTDLGYANDLLPLPYTAETLDRVAAHVAQVQDRLGRRMLLENPSSYLVFEQSTIHEIDFVAEVARRTGCGLLLDVNNVFVSATNLKTSPEAYIDRFPLDLVGEIHLGGHDAQTDEAGEPLLIDSHNAAVVDPVWALYARAIGLAGPKPTLIEWDNDVPDWPVLAAEAERAEAMMADA